MSVSVAESSSILLARALVRALRAQGVRDVVYCPGSRSAPFAYALAEAEAAGSLRCHVRLDERAAAFVAVGLSRAGALDPLEVEAAASEAKSDGQAALACHSEPPCDAASAAQPAAAPSPARRPGPSLHPAPSLHPGSSLHHGRRPRPVALMCTSGGAVAEFHAGVAEASHSDLPLIVISADRPFEMRDVGASQTTAQVGIFGSHVRATWDIPAGTAADARLDAMVARACAAALGAPTGRPGPVHVNVGFRDPLVPEALDFHAACATGPQVLRTAPTALPWEQVVDLSLRTLIVAGDGANPQAASWAEIAGVPLLAEPSSNVTLSAAWVPHQQTLLTAIAGGALSAAPSSAEFSSIALIEQVVVTGRPTLSRPVSALLARADVRIIVEHAHEQWPDVAGQADIVCASLAAPLGPHADAAWLPAWRAAAEEVGRRFEARAAAPSQALSLLTVAEAVWTSEASTLLLGASNSVRAVDLVARGRGRARVCANRGLAGIDGTLATAMGLAWGSGEPVRVMLGDLAFFHDVSALSIAPGEVIPDVQIVVVDDHGGGIFASLEHGRPEYAEVFERWFGTPQDVSVENLARAYGASYYRPKNAADLREHCGRRPRGMEIVHVVIEDARQELKWVKGCLTHP